MRLSEQQKLFASEFVKNGGNGTDAARVAKYKNPEVAASRLLRNDKVIAYIDKLNEEVKTGRIATAQERQEFWTSIFRGDSVDTDAEGNVLPARMTDRIKASELLGKSQADFIDRKEITGDIAITQVERVIVD